jgi:hypothetical protein
MMISTIATKLVPWYLVHIYRLVPARVRGRYPGCPVSSSHMALDWMDQGMNGWAAIRGAFTVTEGGWPKTDRNWMDPSR